MIEYKEHEILSLKKTSFIGLLSSTFDEGYEDYQDYTARLLKINDFQAKLNQYFAILMEENVEEIKKILFSLYKFFLAKDVDFEPYCMSIADSLFGLYIFDKIRKENFLPAAPYFLQLFTEMIYKDKINYLSEYLINNGIIEIIMYFKNTLPKKYYPSIMLFSYNLYSFCSSIVIKKTTEFHRITRSLFNEIDNDLFSFISILASMNLLRNMKIEEKDKNDLIFRNFTLMISETSSEMILINLMWVLYFWFKNSWENTASYINEKFVELISNFISTSEYEVIVEISLYVYCYLWAISDDIKKSYVKKYYPHEKVFALIESDSDDIVRLALVNTNNYISEAIFSDCTQFLSKSSFDKVLEIMANGSTKAKIEAAYVITTSLELISIDLIESFISKDLIEILCEVCLIDLSDESQLTIRILNFLCKIMPNFTWIVSVLSELNFLNEIQSYDATYLTDIISEFESIYMKIKTA